MIARSQVISLLLLFLLQTGYTQTWQVCPGDELKAIEANYESFDSHNFYADVFQRRYLFRVSGIKIDPSCPGASDGDININSILNGIVNEGSGSTDTIWEELIGPVFGKDVVVVGGIRNETQLGNQLMIDNLSNYHPLPAGDYSLTITLLSDGTPYSFATRLKKFVTLKPKLDYSPLVTVIDESCPDAGDGSIELLFDEPDSPNVSVTWTDGQNIYEGTTISGLSTGWYYWTMEYTMDEDPVYTCCATDSAFIDVGPCPETISFDFEDDDFPPNTIVMPAGGVIVNDGHAEFLQNNANITLPTNIPMAEMIDVEVDVTSGAGLIRFLDNLIQTVWFEEFENGINIFNLLPAPNNIVAFEVRGQELTRVQKIVIRSWLNALDDLEAEHTFPVNRSATSDLTFTLCEGESYIMAPNLDVSGGLPPYSFDWDLDDDGDFDDLNGITEPLLFDTAGNYEVTLRIRDDRGSALMVDFNILVKEEDSLTFDVPAYDLFSVSGEVLHICHDAAPFEIIPNMPGATIRSDSLELTNNIFDPGLASPGYYPISIEGNRCERSASLDLLVLDSLDVTLDTAPPLYECTDNYTLDALVLGDTRGIWIIDNQYLEFGNRLDTLPLEIGTHSLTYFIGGQGCLLADSLRFDKLPTPNANLQDIDLKIELDGSPFALDTFFNDSTTTGGIWSGGTYVNDSIFNSEGLDPGMYKVVYTVGTASCMRSDTVYVEITEPTSVISHLLEDIHIYPNPTDDGFFLDLPSNLDKVVLSIHDIRGIPYLTNRIVSDGTWIRPDLNGGIYYVTLMLNQSRITRKLMLK